MFGSSLKNPAHRSYFFGQKFILITDHKPLLAIFGRRKSSSAMVANRLARWALFLNQFDFDVEYRRTTTLHQNADALSGLPQGENEQFDEEEGSKSNLLFCRTYG